MAKAVTVYTSNNCAYCVMVKKYLTMKKIEYSEVNIEENPEKRDEIVAMTGAQTVPVTVVTSDDGKQEFSVGYNLPQLSSLIS